MGIKIVNPNIGFRSSSARTIIRKYGYNWYSWKSGNTKPERMLYGYKVRIVYCGFFVNDHVEIEEKTFQNRDTARIYRDKAIDNLESYDYTIISSSVSLVRL